ncbi:MAG TPA: TIM-barrel domain-containing protein [Polyangia bacterium]|jgi:alpha-glucosidase (family GH31 glycosyl hydrolase)
MGGMRLAVLLGVALGAGCGGGGGAACPHDGTVPATLTVAGGGLTLEVQADPYGYTLRDAAGRAVLTTLGAGAQDGYGSLGWTTGKVAWSNIVSPGYFQFAPTLDPWRDRFRVVAARQEAGRLTLSLEATGARECTTVTHTLTASTLRVEAQTSGAAPRAFAAAFQTPTDEGFLGLGERSNRTEQRGRTLYSWPEEGGLSAKEDVAPGPSNPFPNGEGMSYYPVPFLVSTKGYAFWLDSTWRNAVDLASDRPDAWRVWHIGPRLAYEVYLPDPADARPWTHQVVDRFTARTGRPMIPPAWSFGPRRRIGGDSTVGGVPEIQVMRDEHLAITVADDTCHFLPTGSDVGHEAELRAWTAAARRLGYRVIGYYNPYLADDAESPLRGLYEEGLANGYYLARADGTPSDVWLISGRMLTVYTVDFTNPAATSWFTAMFDRAFALGYSGWMYDFGEYVQPDVVAASGMTGEELHNLFPVIYQQAAHDALEAGPHRGDWYFFARSGYTGSQQYTPMVWSGDPDASFGEAGGLPATVRAGINLSLSGVAHWGSDIGGYKCLADGAVAADGELLARWIQAGALQSNMHDENACTGGSGKATIWTAPAAKEAWRAYAGLHTRLFPYLYTLAHEAHATGAPVIRHLFFEHPDRPELAGVDDAYYFGPALLVAPVVHRGAVSREVDLPPGLYLDWRDGALVAGGGRVTVDAPLAKLPLFLRDGFLVPLLDPAIDTLAEEELAAIVSPPDVADVYDVVGLLSPATGAARFTLWDGGELGATLGGAFAPPALAEAASEADLATCAGCWRRDDLGGGLARIRISATGDVAAGGLTLHAAVGRRVRWDLHLAP